MKIRLAAPPQPDSVVDGYGIRTVIWTQGCSHNCPFCQNPQTHDFNGGEEYDVKEICNFLDILTDQDGITLSGGDPMFQAEASKMIAEYSQKIGLNVWCYTGFTYEELLELAKKKPAILELLENIDVLVDGKFEIEHKSLNVLFRGSTNQRLIDVKASLKNNRVVLYEEDDGILNSWQKKSKLYI